MSELLSLFLSFCQIGLFSVGGGYVAIPLIQTQAVTIHSWLTMEEFMNLVTIAEMTPGPIAINAATFVGMRVCGFLGAVVATLGCITPSLVLVTLLAMLYMKYRSLHLLKHLFRTIKPFTVGFIASAAFSMVLLVGFSTSGIEILPLGVCLFAFVLLHFVKANSILVMVFCGLFSLMLYLRFGIRL